MITTDTGVCNFQAGIILTTGLENNVGSTFGELLMGLPHSFL